MTIALFSLLALFWGGSFLAIKFALSGLPPLFAAFARVLIGTLLAWAFLTMRGERLPRDRRSWAHALGLGITGMAIPWAALFWGELSISGGLSAILNSTVPLFVALFSFFFVRRLGRVSWLEVSGVLCGFFGIMVIFFPELQFGRGFNSQPTTLLAMGAVLLMSISYAVNAIWLKLVNHRMTFNANLTIQGISACAALLVASIVSEGPQLLDVGWTSSMLSSYLGLAYLGVLSTYVGWLIFFELIRRIGPLRAGAVTYLIPLVAIILDQLTFRTWPTSAQLLGALLILTGLALMNWLAPMVEARRNESPQVAKAA